MVVQMMIMYENIFQRIYIGETCKIPHSKKSEKKSKEEYFAAVVDSVVILCGDWKEGEIIH